MHRFLLQTVAAVAIWVVPGLLGLGAHLRADHIPVLGPNPLAGLLVDDSEPPLGEPPAVSPEGSPSPSPEVLPVDAFPPPDCRPATGQAGASSPPGNPNSSVSPGGLPAGAGPNDPELITLLRLLEEANLPDPVPSSIFHPPRAVSHA